MKRIYLISLLIFLSNSPFAARDTFILKELNVTTVKAQKIVNGDITAKSLSIKYSGNEFKARNSSGDPVEASVSIFDRVFNASSSFLKYSTTLEDDNPLIALDELTLTNGNIHFDKIEMNFSLPYARIKLGQTSLEANSLIGLCDPLGDTTTDVDIVCLKNGHVDIDKIHFINDSIDMLGKGLNVTITPENLNFNSNSTLFISGEQRTRVNTFKVNCKNGIDRRFNRAELLAGCFESANLHLDGFSEYEKSQVLKLSNNSKGLIDLEDIKNLKVDIRNHAVNIHAKIKIFFHFKFKVRSQIHFLEEQGIVKLDIEKATMAGIPAKSLTLMLLKMFLDEDSIKIEDDTIFIAL